MFHKKVKNSARCCYLTKFYVNDGFGSKVLNTNLALKAGGYTIVILLLPNWSKLELIFETKTENKKILALFNIHEVPSSKSCVNGVTKIHLC